MDKYNNIFKALSDPTRRTILNLLKKRNFTPGQLHSHFHITKPSLSHHLEILKKADLIQAERKGQHLVYSINTSVLDEVLAVMMNLFQIKSSKRR